MTEPARSEASLASDLPGARLAEARIAHGLSVEGVAQQLKFSARQIEALEADRYEALPGVAVVRGMVRGYARLVHLDAGPLLDALRDSVPAPDANRIIARYREPVPFSDGAKRSNVVYVVFTVAVLAVAALVLVQWRQDRPEPVQMTFVPAAKMPPETVSNTPASGGDATPAQPVIEAAPVAAPAETPSSTSDATDVSSSGSSTGLSTESSAGSTTAAGTPPATVSGDEKDDAPAAAAGDTGARAGATQTAATGANGEAAASALHRVELEFQQDAWVEIRNAKGKVLHSQLNAGGSEVRVEGDTPLSFVIGNAQYVRLRFDGREVDLAPYIRVAVARFTLP